MTKCQHWWKRYIQIKSLVTRENPYDEEKLYKLYKRGIKKEAETLLFLYLFYDKNLFPQSWFIN